MIFLLTRINKYSNYLLLISLSFAVSAHANNAVQTESYLATLQEQATQQHLWKDQECLNLLHYEGSDR